MCPALTNSCVGAHMSDDNWVIDDDDDDARVGCDGDDDDAVHQ